MIQQEARALLDHYRFNFRCCVTGTAVSVAIGAGGLLAGLGMGTVGAWMVSVAQGYAAYRWYRRLRREGPALLRYDARGYSWQCHCPTCGFDCVPPNTQHLVPWVPDHERDPTVCGECGRILLFVRDGHVIGLREPTERELREILREQGPQLEVWQRMVRLRPLVDPKKEPPWEILQGVTKCSGTCNSSPSECGCE